MSLLLVLDLVGTFVFALSGAMAGVKHRLDLFGFWSSLLRREMSVALPATSDRIGSAGSDQRLAIFGGSRCLPE